MQTTQAWGGRCPACGGAAGRWSPREVRSGASREAFSLVELVAVMVVVGIMAAVAVPAWNAALAARSGAAARLVARDLGYARERAVATGCRSWVVFTVPDNAYVLLAEPPALPGRSNAVPIPAPASPGTVGQQFGSGTWAGVALGGAAFDGAPEVGFDWAGRPLNAAGNPLAADGSVWFTSGRTVVVRAGWGVIVAP